MVPRLFTQDTGSDPVPGREGLFYSAGDPMSGRAGVRDGENCSRMERPPWMQRLAPPYTLSPCVSLWPPPPARRSNPLPLPSTATRVTAWRSRWHLASELTARGASTTEVMLAGNWKTARMVAHYSAGATAERGAVRKYL